MDVLKYLNSRDVAEYLESINFEFNAMQAAYVIYINEWLPMRERLRLWQEIVETMPDCEYRYMAEGLTCIMPSAHTAIMEHVEKIEELLAAFESSEFDKDEIVFSPMARRGDSLPVWASERVHSKEHSVVRGIQWGEFPGGAVFKSFEKCVQYLKSKSDIDASESKGCPESYDRYRIRLRYLDSDYANCHSESHKSKLSDFLLSGVVLNGDFEIIDFETGWSSEDFEGFVPGIPHPFEGGDIVIDTSNATALPFVFDRCVTWTLEDGPHAGWEDIVNRDSDGVTETECGKPLLWRSVTIDEFSEAARQRGGRFWFSDVLNYDHGHMFVSGYTVAVDEPASILEYWLSACDNFINLEYYKGPFEGRLSILPAVSWFVMNEEREQSNFEARYKKEEKAVERFRSRDIGMPLAGAYDICSLVNAGFRLG